MADTKIPSDSAYCPDHDGVFKAMMSLLPPGTAFDNIENKYDRDSLIRQFVSGIALSWLHLEDAMCIAIDEWFCLSARLDLDQWEIDYGIPDDCDIYNQNLCAKVQTGQQPTTEHLLGLLSASGIQAEGRWLTGTDDEYPGVHSTFRVVVDTSISPAYQLSTSLRFQLGYGRRLGHPDLLNLDCMLERYVPAHCVVDIAESGKFQPVAALGSRLKLWWNADTTIDGQVLSWVDTRNALAATGLTGAVPTSAVFGGTGGWRWLTFDGINDYLKTANSTLIPSGATVTAFFALFEQVASAADRQVICKTHTNSSSDGERRMETRLQPWGHALGVAESDTTELIDSTSGNVLIDVNVGVALFNATELGGRVYGRWTEPDRIPAPLSSPSNPYFIIGARAVPTLTDFAQIKLRHLMVVVDPTPHEIMQLEGWLAWDVRRADVLDGSHPYSNVRP